MMFETLIAPESLPITVEELKDQLAISISQYDSLLYSLILTATELAENHTNGSLITTIRQFYTSGFCSVIRIPYGRIQSVIQVEYRTPDGVWNTLPESVWDFARLGNQGFIMPKQGQSFPSVALYPISPVRITFQSGFGASSDQVPEPVKHALKLIAAYLFANREDGSVAIPQAAQHLLANYRSITQELF